MGLLDGIIRLDYGMVFFHPNMGSVVVHSSQGRSFLFFAMLCCAIASRGRFLFLHHFLKKGHCLSNNLSLDMCFLKNADSCLDFVIVQVDSRSGNQIHIIEV